MTKPKTKVKASNLLEVLQAWALKNRKVLTVEDIQRNAGQSKYIVDYADLFFKVASLAKSCKRGGR